MQPFVIFFALLFLSGCHDPNDFEAPQRWFSEHRIGYSADYGVMKRNTELVTAVFGFANDASVCQEIANRFNIEEPGTYSCIQLNK